MACFLLPIGCTQTALPNAAATFDAIVDFRASACGPQGRREGPDVVARSDWF